MNTKPFLHNILTMAKKPGIAITLLLAVALTAHAGDVVIESGRINADGYVTSTVPAFYAENTAHVSAIQYIVWDSVSLNSGGHYNATTGRFTAPVDGLYYFSWGGIDYPPSVVSRTYLHKNGTNTGAHLRLDGSNNSSDYDGGSLSRILDLDAGDWVAVYLGAGGITGNYGSFTGYLITAQ